MNKKEARRRKHRKQKLITRQNILESEIIGEEEKETLLGNLAPVKQIPMLPWHEISVTPTFRKTLHIPYEPGGDWYEDFLTGIANNEECDLLGFMPVAEKDEADPFQAVAPGNIGIAAQIEKVEKGVDKSLLIQMQGICRFENLGFLPAPEHTFIVKVRWFEDTPEPEAAWLQPFKTFLQNIERLSRASGERLKHYFNATRTAPVHYLSAQYGSFSFINMIPGLFTFEEQIELIKLTSTSERLKKVNARLERYVPVFEKTVPRKQIEKNN